ncbi:MAG: PTS sugar transporter subunit IIC [Tetragenococcus halophilus]|uniref:Uncharacterized protein n=5 Tax=Tetragenococcus TaxID=51668 RepID=A0A2H6DBS8_TETHA|nr:MULTISPECIES: PTS sugar transporter subunit IIC [Tetragenococcus]AOF48656.1 membrane protein [Tetragenococcus halophilus]MCF1600867.1 PTS sugar transporter subunit IIC [Tetragenococcus halophilus]MCF1684787.1 PTS sugar transporter subunit IIC [Tetragenococcus halophilus]MCO7026270.1 PTS sugar transporter subunit IIC [Tetragenococcus halophilus]MCO8286294.1 PTS sugar transporter subunit IIC [Tetragenococcus halophilus]
MTQQVTPREFIMNILNGLAIGTVIVLIPSALLSELCKALLPTFPFLINVLNAVNLSNSMMGIVIGTLIGINFKFPPIQSAAVGLASIFASGAVNFTPDGMLLEGTGDIINIGLTAAMACGMLLFLGNKLKSYTILVIPALSLIIPGIIGRLILPYILKITEWIGQGIAQLLDLQPLVMSILLAVIFSVLIVSPITTVGIALAISLSGIGSGAANIGICATGFGFAIMGWHVNTKGTSFAHFIGSPKMSMANALKKPLILLPIICTAACCGVLAALWDIQGSPMSAGFGFSGLIGPINYMNLAEDGWTFVTLLKSIIAFAVAPIAFSFLFKYLFTKVTPILKEEDYYLNI